MKITFGLVGRGAARSLLRKFSKIKREQRAEKSTILFSASYARFFVLVQIRFIRHIVLCTLPMRNFSRVLSTNMDNDVVYFCAVNLDFFNRWLAKIQ